MNKLVPVNTSKVGRYQKVRDSDSPLSSQSICSAQKAITDLEHVNPFHQNTSRNITLPSINMLFPVLGEINKFLYTGERVALFLAAPSLFRGRDSTSRLIIDLSNPEMLDFLKRARQSRDYLYIPRTLQQGLEQLSLARLLQPKAPNESRRLMGRILENVKVSQDMINGMPSSTDKDDLQMIRCLSEVCSQAFIQFLPDGGSRDIPNCEDKATRVYCNAILTYLQDPLNLRSFSTIAKIVPKLSDSYCKKARLLEVINRFEGQRERNFTVGPLTSFWYEFCCCGDDIPYVPVDETPYRKEVIDLILIPNSTGSAIDDSAK